MSNTGSTCARACTSSGSPFPGVGPEPLSLSRRLVLRDLSAANGNALYDPFTSLVELRQWRRQLILGRAARRWRSLVCSFATWLMSDFIPIYLTMMRIRSLITAKKVQTTDTSWSHADLQPRHAPIYKRTKPIRAGWQWRSAQAESGNAKFVLLAECNPRRGGWKAALILETENGASVVSRLEDHMSHPGLHLHADCDRGGQEIGASGLDGLGRRPSAGARHRRLQAWTENAFWEAAKTFFRIEERKGPLI
jgi:hypothetical protein